MSATSEEGAEAVCPWAAGRGPPRAAASTATFLAVRIALAIALFDGHGAHFRADRPRPGPARASRRRLRATRSPGEQAGPGERPGRDREVDEAVGRPRDRQLAAGARLAAHGHRAAVEVRAAPSV